MEKNKTAVEWFAEELSKLGYLHSCEHGNSPKVLDALKKAKAMEAEQMDYARRMSMLCSCDENEPATKVLCCDSCGKIAEGYWVTKLHDYNPGC